MPDMKYIHYTFTSNTRRPVLRIWVDNLVFLGSYERNHT